MPQLAAPNDGLQVATLQDLAQMTLPFKNLPFREILKTIDVSFDDETPIVLIKPVGGVTSLTLDLSWQYVLLGL